VTGAAGFIGSHLCARLVAEGHEVTGVDAFMDYYPRAQNESNLLEISSTKNFSLVEGDILELDLKSYFENTEYIFHLAAQPGVRGSWGSSFDIYVHNNILATQKVLEAAKGLPLKKLVCASSSSIYGDAEAFPTPEVIIPQPVSPYGVTKLATEHLCSLYHKNHGVPTVCLRFFTVYGPSQRPDMAFNRFIRAVVLGKENQVYGDGEQTRDFTYVDDTVEGAIRAAKSDMVGDVFNIGGGSRTTVNDVLRLIEKILDRPALVAYLPAQPGDVRHTAACIDKASSVIGYEPKIRLEQGLRAEVNWLQKFLSASLSGDAS
jgi:UDP-glucose 4-epimerase